MDNLLHISLLQFDIKWENRETNITSLEKMMSGLQSDLIVLPEMFTTGFTMEPENIAEKPLGKTHSWMKEIAAAKKCVITGSLVTQENGKYYNRLIWMYPDGNFATYDKRHLFRMAGEHKKYTAGNRKLIVNYRGWKICPLICYDLRFPVWSRNTEMYDLLIYIANFPAARSAHWNCLLKARAIENQCYVAGLNRTGTDAREIKYWGESRIINPIGNIIASSPEKKDGIIQTAISLKALKKYQQEFPFSLDSDSFHIVP